MRQRYYGRKVGEGLRLVPVDFVLEIGCDWECTDFEYG